MSNPTHILLRSSPYESLTGAGLFSGELSSLLDLLESDETTEVLFRFQYSQSRYPSALTALQEMFPEKKFGVWLEWGKDISISLIREISRMLEGPILIFLPEKKSSFGLEIGLRLLRLMTSRTLFLSGLDPEKTENLGYYFVQPLFFQYPGTLLFESLPLVDTGLLSFQSVKFSC